MWEEVCKFVIYMNVVIESPNVLDSVVSFDSNSNDRS